MAKAKFVAPKRIKSLKTLAREYNKLMREFEGIKARLEAVKASIRFHVGPDQETVVKTVGGTWFEVKNSVGKRVIFAAELLREKIDPKELKKCEREISVHELIVKPVSEDYVLENYDL